MSHNHCLIIINNVNFHIIISNISNCKDFCIEMIILNDVSLYSGRSLVKFVTAIENYLNCSVISLITNKININKESQDVF